jgi:hypothetical protein
VIDDSALTARVGEAAAALRALATRLATHGLGARWEGPARRACEVQLFALEEALRTHARQLDALVASRGVTRW